MPDEIERTIYKLELDDSGYIRGVESMSESTKRLVEVQNQSNKQLQTNEAALKANSDFIIKAKKDLDAYTGSNEAYRKQLEKQVTDAQGSTAKLTQNVNESRKAYEAATKAAQDFANSSQKAANLVPAGATKVPTVVPLGIQPTVVSDLTNIIKTGDLSGLPEVLAESAAQFEVLRNAITDAEQRMQSLNAADQEFIALQEFVQRGSVAVNAYDNAVQLAATSTVELTERVREAQIEVERIGQVSPSELPEQVKLSKIQFDELAVSISGAEARLKTLDDGSEEFKQLAPVIEQGRAALESYNAATVKTGQSTLSLRSQIRLGRDELVRMEAAGEGLTKEYIELEKRVASLTNAFGDQQDRIKVLASDTRALDFGKAAIQSATSAFQVFTSVSILAGGASEKLQKQTLQLFAAMQLLTSLEQLANTVKRGGVLITNLQSAAQATYTAVVGASTGALRVFRTALLSTGIGAVVIGIGILVTKLSQIAGEASKAAEAQKRLNDVMSGAKDAYVKAVTEVDNLKIAFEEVSAGIRTQESAVKLYNDTIGKTTGAVKTLDEAEQALAKNADDYIQFTLLKAAAQIALGEAAQKAFEIQQKVDSPITGQDRQRQALELNRQAGFLALQAQTAAQKAGKDEAGIRAAYNEAFDKAIAEGRAGKEIDAKAGFEKIAKDLQDRAKAFAIKLGVKIDIDPIDTKPAEDSFASKLKELQSRLAEVTAKSFESEGTIREQFATSLEKEINSIKDKFEKDLRSSGVPGKTRFEVLVELAARINSIQLQESLNQFNKKVKDARQKIEDDLNALQSKVALDSINLIKDEFDRRAAIIDFNEQKELADAKKANEDRLASLDLNRLLIGEQAYQDARAEIIEKGEQNIQNIIARGNAARQVLAQDSFDKLLDNIGGSLDERDVQAAEQLAEQLQNERDRLDAGLISRKEFEDNVSEITKAAVDYRRFLHETELKQQLEAINVAIEATDDPVIKENLKKRQREIRKALAEIKGATATGNEDDPVTPTIEKINEYAQAIGGLVDSIIGFWQKANEAEAAALDRSIALQEKRVDAAQRIAERGNAQYLKAETDRLKELQVARENAARREIGINAALQASQLLVGITGAITKIADPVSGPAEVIASIAVIIGALATGYALAKSLQGNQPQFKTGTTYVERGAQPRGEDTIPAWLSEGEAVIPEKTNKSYKKAVEAIYHEKVPANVLNEFVENYVSNNKIINKTETVKYANENLNTYNNFVRNISNVPTSVLNEFISNYISNKTDSIKIPVLDKLVKEVNYSKEIAKTAVANYSKVVNIIHTVKPIAQPNYQRIGEAATTHIQHDSKLAGLLMEQNRLLIENTEVQRQTLNAFKKNKIDVHYDAEGLAVHQMEIMDKKQKDKYT